MISFYAILTILTVHTLFDYKFQTRWQADNKSKSLIALTNHVAIYTVGLSLIPVLSVYFNLGNFTLTNYFIFVLTNAILHWITDFFTSRASSEFYTRRSMANFWMTIGFDQFIHTLILFKTFILLTH